MKALVPLIALILIGAQSLVLACGQEADAPATRPAGGEAQGGSDATAEPFVIITSPESGTVVPAGPITIKASALNFIITQRTNGVGMPGHGHFIFYRDVDSAAVASSDDRQTRGRSHETDLAQHTWENVQPGRHTFSVQLVDDAGAPLNPPQIASVIVTVQ